MWYYNYWWGMNGIWWFVWFIVLIWIFALPFDVPGQRRRRDSPLDILKKRFASGEIDQKEYQARKAELEKK